MRGGGGVICADAAPADKLRAINNSEGLNTLMMNSL
jgi:hypothetical protein